MNEYYFLFILAFFWIIFAAIQDLKTREVANWLTFSLLAIALIYRAFYSLHSSEWNFFLVGVSGFITTYLLALGFYYGKVFAGGDAKLLMGLGALTPVSSLLNMGLYLCGFIFVLFFAGSIYSLIYSIFLIRRNSNNFKRLFIKNLSNNMVRLGILLAGIAILAVLLLFPFSGWSIITSLFLLSIPFLSAYLLALEKSCMTKLTNSFSLTEGDWLVQKVRVKNTWIHPSVHGLSIADIKLLRSAKKSVYIKEGIPFVPAFLIALLVMGFAFASVGSDWASWLFSLL